MELVGNKCLDKDSGVREQAISFLSRFSERSLWEMLPLQLCGNILAAVLVSDNHQPGMYTYHGDFQGESET